MVTNLLEQIYADQDKWQSRVDNAHKRLEIATRSLSRANDHLGIIKMVEAIRDALAPEFPNQTLSVLGPFGLGHTTSIHAYPIGLTDDQRRGNLGSHCVGSLTFRPTQSVVTNGVWQTRLVLVDYTRQTAAFPEGSLGAYNGLNFAEVEVPETTEELVALLWAEIKEKG